VLRSSIFFALAVILAAAPPNAVAQIVTDMTPERIAEAIAAGEKNKVASGEMWESSGWAWGRAHIATFSTPFMRVAAAARQAKREYRKFTPADVTEDMVAQELHIYAWPKADISVQAVVITPRRGNREEKAAASIHSERFIEIPMVFQNLFGAEFEGVGQMAVFPLSALSKDNEVHVVYSGKVVIGTNRKGPTVTCDDCKVGFDLDNVR
jgi:hypothetical protein